MLCKIFVKSQKKYFALKETTNIIGHLFRQSYKFYFKASLIFNLNFDWSLTFSSCLKILRGIQQGPISQPILHNLFTNYLLFFINTTKVCKFCDDTALYPCSLNYKEANQKLYNDTHIILKCFRIKMVANPEKLQMFLGSGIDNIKITFSV